MDGLKTLKALIGRNRDLPVILNTASPLDRDCFKRWGAEAYVLKSSDLTGLKEKIREALAKKKKSDFPPPFQLGADQDELIDNIVFKKGNADHP